MSNSDQQKSYILSNQDVNLLLDALDALRKSDDVPISEISVIGVLADKLMSWLSQASFGIDLSGHSHAKDPLGIIIEDQPQIERPQKDSLGKSSV
jgi:hypothetical protein